MARTPFPVEILTPEGEAFKGEIEMLSTRTAVGSIGILANHQPLLATLEPTELRLYRSENEIERFAQGEGYLQVSPEGALMLVDELLTPGELNQKRLQEHLAEAEGRLQEASRGSEKEQLAKRGISRYRTFLEIAQGKTERS